MGQYVNGVHVVFIPFDNCEDELEGVDNWNTYNSQKGVSVGNSSFNLLQSWKLKRRFEAVSGTKAKIPDNLNFSQSPNNVMYVLGHCESGAFSLSASSGGESVGYKDLAKRVSDLIGNPNFAGGIKIYGCDSASGFLIAVSFTHSFAKALIEDHGYRSCTIYGYTATVSNYQPRRVFDTPEGTETTFHKTVALDKTYIKGFIVDFFGDGSSHTELRRAKDARIVVADKGRLMS